MDRRELESNVQGGLKELRTLRDEVRVQLHLAGLEARAKWAKEMEPQIQKAELLGHHVTEIARDAVHEAVAQVKRFRESLGVPRN